MITMFTIISMILGIVNFLLLIWVILIVNNGFIFTNKNIDNYGAKNSLLVKKCDEIVGKYKLMMKNIDDEK